MFWGNRKNSRRLSHSGARRRKPNAGTSAATYGTLEGRRLLAGNVTVFNGENLFIRGDNADNQIEIIGNDNGTISVIGKNGTTINGDAAPLVISDNVTATSGDGARASFAAGLRANIGRGDDSILIEGVEFIGSSIVYAGDGNDSVGAYQTNFGDRLLLQTFTGNDSVSLDNVRVGGDLHLLTLEGADTVGLDATRIAGETFVVTGDGADSIAIQQVSTNSNVMVLSQNGNDYITFENNVVGGHTGIFGGDGNDEISLDYRGSGILNRTIVGGQSDTDRYELQASGDQLGSFDLRTFEAQGIEGNPAKRQQVIDDLIVSGARLGTITELAVLTPDLSVLTGALVATGLDSALNGDGPFTAFAPLNSAFDKLPDGLLAGLSTEELADILQFHVVAGDAVFASTLVTLTEVETLLGRSFDVDISDGVVLNGNATLAATDIRAKNGVVHLLNDVLVPAAEA